MEDMATQIPLVSPEPLVGDPVSLPVKALVKGKTPALIGPKPDAAFKTSIETYGILQPILVVKHGEGKLEVRDGRRRLRAAFEAELDSIPAYVVEANGWHDSMLSAVANEQRSENGAATLAALEEAMKDGASEQDLFDATGIPKGRIRSLLRLQKLIPALRKAFDEGTITQTVAAGCCRFDVETQEELAGILKEKGKLTWVEVAATRKARATAKQASLIEGLDDPDSPNFDWEAYVGTRLREARNVAPEDSPVRALIEQALNLLDGRAPQLSVAEPEKEPAGV